MRKDVVDGVLEGPLPVAQRQRWSLRSSINEDDTNNEEWRNEDSLKSDCTGMIIILCSE